MTHTQLIERLMKAEGPDVFLDAHIRDALEPPAQPVTTDCPPYTASIDAALSLVSRVLPGVAVSIDGIVADGPAYVHHHPDNKPSPALDALVSTAVDRLKADRWTCELHWFINPAWSERGDSYTAPLAILIAALTALQARSNT